MFASSRWPAIAFDFARAFGALIAVGLAGGFIHIFSISDHHLGRGATS
jgi:hypothetical protein